VTKLGRLPFYECVPPEIAALVSDANIESFSEKVEKATFGLSLEAVSVVVTCEVEVRQV
jgi:hypothetical protein